MSSLTYRWGRDHEGELGWVAQGYPNFNASMPALMAHDILEHFPRGQKHGPFVDEALALGARLYLRVTSGWWAQQIYSEYTSPAQSWAGEIANILQDMDEEDFDLPKIPTKYVDDVTEVVLCQVMKAAVTYIRNELASADHALAIQTAGCLVNWMRVGYHGAIKRYKGTDPLNVMWLAEQIQERAKYFRFGDEGDLLTFRVNEKDLEFDIIHKSI